MAFADTLGALGTILNLGHQAASPAKQKGSRLGQKSLHVTNMLFGLPRLKMQNAIAWSRRFPDNRAMRDVRLAFEEEKCGATTSSSPSLPVRVCTTR